jgi:hypothetical protein
MGRTEEWSVRLSFFEESGTTTARMEIDTGVTTLTGHGLARCRPEEVDVPRIGDELAAGRAASDLAQQLLRMADQDLEGVGTANPSERSHMVPQGWPSTITR